MMTFIAQYLLTVLGVMTFIVIIFAVFMIVTFPKHKQSIIPEKKIIHRANYISARDAAKMLKISMQRIYYLLKIRRLVAKKDKNTGYLLIRKKDVESLMKKK